MNEPNAYLVARNAIGFLRSCLRSGKALSDNDDLHVEAALDLLREAEAAALAEPPVESGLDGHSHPGPRCEACVLAGIGFGQDIDLARAELEHLRRARSLAGSCGEDFMAGAICMLPAGHSGAHRSGE